jgi:hypothetical protein
MVLHNFTVHQRAVAAAQISNPERITLPAKERMMTGNRFMIDRDPCALHSSDRHLVHAYFKDPPPEWSSYRKELRLIQHQEGVSIKIRASQFG